MANALYNAAKAAFPQGNIDWVNDTIKAQLVDAADYTRDLVNDDNFDDIPGAARVGTATALTGKTVSAAGVLGANDLTFLLVSGDEAEYLVLYKDTGVESTSTLIACIDTAIGLPVPPAGGNINIIWDTGPSGIYAF